MSEPTEPPTADPIEPKPIRDASSVLLLRDDPATGRPSVWMMTRVENMVFAAGASVFAGGRVEDADATLPWSGRPAQEFAARFDCDVALARALVGAAIRETFEETGVLLSSPAASLVDAQADVEAGRISFGSLLAEHGLAIDADAIAPWGRWVTPDVERHRRRYDTRFFVAKLPAGVEATNLTTESVVSEWVSPAETLAAAERGERMLLTPTVKMLQSILKYDTVDEILAASPTRRLTAVRPVVEVDSDGQLWAIQPDGSRQRAE